MITENHSPLINELVWIACRAIRDSSEPSVQSAYLHYYRARENQRLQNELRDRVKADGLQLNPNELAVINSMPSKADNKILFDIAKRHGIISAGVSKREYMRSLWAASLAMTAMDFDKDWNEVKQMIFSTGKLFEYKRDWRIGIRGFCFFFVQILPLPLTVTVPWFAICLTLAFVAAGSYKSKWHSALAITLAILLTLMWGINKLIGIANNIYSKYLLYDVTPLAYFLILSVIIGILGIRLRRWTVEHGNGDKILTGLWFICGMLLMSQFIFNPRVQWGWFYNYTGNIFCNIPLHFLVLRFMAGAVMTIYAVKSYFKMQATGRVKRFNILPELSSYILWGITAAWIGYLLTMVYSSLVDAFVIDTWTLNIAIPALLKNCSGQQIISIGIGITAFISSILFGLLLARSSLKKRFWEINIFVLVLLIAILTILTFFISCGVQRYNSYNQVGDYIKIKLL